MRKPLFPFLVFCLFTLPVHAEGMRPWHAVVLGVVEGLTEYLPVSSTGHLILAERILGLGVDESTKSVTDSYTIVIQLGAILAVAAVYGRYLLDMLLGLFGKNARGLRLLINLCIAFLPAAVVGLLAMDLIKSLLFGLWPVTIAWLVGGAALVIWGDRSRDGENDAGLSMDDLTPRKALLIGLLQTIAVWPGTSRSLVTILGGRLAGLTLRDSVIFSFLLGMVTLTASTGLDLLQSGGEMVSAFGLGNLLLGMVTAGLFAWLAVKGMVAYLKRHGLKAFGYYRILLALGTGLLLLTGHLST
jgi:undecaprenyl-diphosphatase